MQDLHPLHLHVHIAIISNLSMMMLISEDHIIYNNYHLMHGDIFSVKLVATSFYPVTS